MAWVQLPWELVEEILSRVPPKSLVRFRTVCKQWNALFHEKRFVKTQFDHACPQFLIFCGDKTFSIDVNLNAPSIEMRQIHIDIPGMHSWVATPQTHCDGLLVCVVFMNVTAVLNPVLRQGRQIITKEHRFELCGIGYDNSRPEISYKILGYYCYTPLSDPDTQRKLAIYECASDTWKYSNAPYKEWPIREPEDRHLSLNGNSYWTAYNMETSEYFIRTFDFSRDILKHFCLLPCKKNQKEDVHYLSVFRGDRFSMLEQCYTTREIEIWVTNKKIGKGHEEDVSWLKFMNVSIPDIPRLFDYHYYGPAPSYFVDNVGEKSFVLCDHDETTQAKCIYLVRGNMSRKFKIDSMTHRLIHSVYVPSLFPIASESSSYQDNNKN